VKQGGFRFIKRDINERWVKSRLLVENYNNKIEDHHMSNPTARIGDNKLSIITRITREIAIHCRMFHCNFLTDGDTCGMRQPAATVNLVLKGCINTDLKNVESRP